MTAHKLAELLLSMPDYPVMINGWGSDEGVTCEVTKAIVIKPTDRPEEIHLDHDDVNWGS